MIFFANKLGRREYIYVSLPKVIRIVKMQQSENAAAEQETLKP
jgi:hypothetical protein